MVLISNKTVTSQHNFIEKKRIDSIFTTWYITQNYIESEERESYSVNLFLFWLAQSLTHALNNEYIHLISIIPRVPKHHTDSMNSFLKFQPLKMEKKKIEMIYTYKMHSVLGGWASD